MFSRGHLQPLLLPRPNNQRSLVPQRMQPIRLLTFPIPIFPLPLQIKTPTATSQVQAASRYTLSSCQYNCGNRAGRNRKQARTRRWPIASEEGRNWKGSRSRGWSDWRCTGGRRRESEGGNCGKVSLAQEEKQACHGVSLRVLCMIN